MTSKTITITEAARSLSDYVNRVVYRRESFVLCRGGKPSAELRPVPAGVRLGDLPAVLASLPRLTPEEADSFARDIDAARDSLSKQGLRDPWQS